MIQIVAEDTASAAPQALVAGEPVTKLPKDLYIPPDALEVILDAFEGPLDLLLYLIKKQNLNILDIPVARITEQYMEYIHLLQGLRLELAADYLVMAAMLAEIKSRMLLPRSESTDEDEEDPRAELVRRLLEYERFKEAAENLNEMPRMQRDLHEANAPAPAAERIKQLPQVSTQELVNAFAKVLERAQLYEHHTIKRETLSVRARMSQLLERLQADVYCHFQSLFDPREGRLGVVVTFMAILELVREQLVDISQPEPFTDIRVKAKATTDIDTDDRPCY